MTTKIAKASVMLVILGMRVRITPGVVEIVSKVGIVTVVGIVRRDDPQLLSDKTTFVVPLSISF